MKFKFIFLIVCVFFILGAINAQSFISVSTGISTDLNNNNNSFYHIPVSVQWKPSAEKKFPLFLEINYDIPFTNKGSGNAYTLNPAMSQEVTLPENIRAYIFTMSIGFRIHLFTTKKNNSFFFNVLPLSVCSQNFKVTYKNYDKENYEVLNPDVHLNATGAVMSMAAVYNFHKQKQDMMMMLHLQSPLLKWTNDYPMSYKFISPLQLTFGYNFYYKNENEIN